MSSSGRTVYVDTEDCIGCAACVDVCPDVFEYLESVDKAMVRNPSGASDEEIEEAMEICPVNCIHWEGEAD
jgi:ferredoxin